MPALREEIAAELAACADPVRAELGLARLGEDRPLAMERLGDEPGLRRAVVAVMAASPFLTRTCTTDPDALDVLATWERSVSPTLPLARWKALEALRLAARDLCGLLSLEQVGGALSDLADQLLAAAVSSAGQNGLAVIGMGKLGARELNYGSDIDIIFVGEGDPQPVLAEVRTAWRTDVALRPEGRSGPLVRSLASYQAYWDRWAKTWEFQALLKARPVAGPRTLGSSFAAAASQTIWGRPLGAEDLRSLRAMKARAEQLVSRRGLSHREIKRGEGGIRDIEFAVQLLQLVHGREDETLREPATLDALSALASGGYVAAGDAAGLAGAYRFMRSVEHRLQLFEDRQVHAVPSAPGARAHLARVMGYRDGARGPALAEFDADLGRHQAKARSVHERLFFRPLLEAFTTAGNTAVLSQNAATERLAAFGFSDAARTREAVVELTQGFSRTSRLMQAMVPLVLDWLSQAPSPDLGLLGLRRLTTGLHRRNQVSALFRESPEAARRLCLLLGTGPGFAVGYERHPEQLALLESGPPPLPDRAALLRRAADGLSWRPRGDWWRGLSALHRGELLRAQARDVLGLADPAATGAALAQLAEAVLDACLSALAGEHFGDAPGPPGVAIIAMGRFGGAELAYSSDLDVMLAFDDEEVAPEKAEHFAENLLRLVKGATPAQRLYELDFSLRPEGRKGPLARSLRAFETYYGRWAQVWERQALTRGRFVAGDPVTGARFHDIAGRFLWGRPLSVEDEREIRRIKARVERERVPAGEDPEFHLKLGPGSLSDVEWTAQLLQMRHGVRGEGTLDALNALIKSGALDASDGKVLSEAYRFCELTRNRLYLVRGLPGDSLPPPGSQLTALAHSLGMTAPDLRDEYRRVTRRSRKVVERLFYGGSGTA